MKYAEPLVFGFYAVILTTMPWAAWWALLSSTTTGQALTTCLCLLEFTVLFAWAAGWMPDMILRSLDRAIEAEAKGGEES